MGAPTLTESPSETRRRTSTPATSELYSTIAFSVSISASGWPTVMVSPSETSQPWIAASVAFARTSGIRTIVAISGHRPIRA